MSGWTFVFEGFDPEVEGQREALCTLGNGYVATRGAAPESAADGVHYPGTYMAGYYDRLVTRIAGRRVENEDLVNMPNWLVLAFRADGEDWFDMASVEVLAHRLDLDLRGGVLVRRTRFRDGEGRTTDVTQRRFVSMRDPHIAGLETTFVAKGWSGPMEVRSALDGTVRNAGVPRYRSLRGDHLVRAGTFTVDGEAVGLEVRTRGSHLRVGAAARTRVLRGGRIAEPDRRSRIQEPGTAGHDLVIQLEDGVPVTVEKVVTVYGSRDHATYEPRVQAAAVRRAPSFARLLDAHRLTWEQLWQRFDIELGCTERAQLVLRMNIFHLIQTASENTIDLDVGVPARGLHGEAYRGHVFWDELFIFPFINLRMPALTRSLLGYRYRRLPEARAAAKEAGFAGAMFPWQSGSDGREESQTLHLNPRSGRWLPDSSHLQRHVGSAIAYNAWLYHQVTADLGFLRFRAGPLILEVARFWASAASYDPERDRFEIRGVMGPDEYHDGYPGATEPGLNNNAYTNVMAAWVLCRALDVLEALPSHHRQELIDELDLTGDELQRWDEISRKLFVPFHGDGIVSQFEGYADLEELDWLDYAERYGNVQRLDRILEAEGDSPNRYKVSKQADVLMLFYLLSPEELRSIFGRLGYPFDPTTDIRKNALYYLQRTSHGSTLSRLVHAWVLARIDRPRSWRFFMEALESDVSDIQGGTTAEGVHLGAMAGSVDLVQRCYGGIETHEDVLWLRPVVPDEITHLRFGIHYRGHRISVEIVPDRLVVTTAPGVAQPIRVGMWGKVFEFGPAARREVRLAGRPLASLEAARHAPYSLLPRRARRQEEPRVGRERHMRRSR
jgi:alpha,alpha-trehalase